ncbi:MAG: hypothetical protein ACK5NN_08605, partial [Sphingomonadaceae bacterium]
DVAGYFYEVDTKLPASGDWTIEVDVAGALGTGVASFVLPVESPHTLNRPLIIGATVVVLVLLALFGLRSRVAASKPRSQRKRQRSSQRS